MTGKRECFFSLFHCVLFDQKGTRPRRFFRDLRVLCQLSSVLAEFWVKGPLESMTWLFFLRFPDDWSRPRFADFATPFRLNPWDFQVTAYLAAFFFSMAKRPIMTLADPAFSLLGPVGSREFRFFEILLNQVASSTYGGVASTCGGCDPVGFQGTDDSFPMASRTPVVVGRGTVGIENFVILLPGLPTFGRDPVYRIKRPGLTWICQKDFSRQVTLSGFSFSGPNVRCGYRFSRDRRSSDQWHRASPCR